MEEMNYEKLKKYIGNVFKKHRRLKENISLERSSGRIDVDPNNLARIERGEQLPSTMTLLKLIHGLDIKQEDFLPTAIEIMMRDEEEQKKEDASESNHFKLHY